VNPATPSTAIRQNHLMLNKQETPQNRNLRQSSPFAYKSNRTAGLRTICCAFLRVAVVPLTLAKSTVAQSQDGEAGQQIDAAERAVRKAIAKSHFAAPEKLWSPQMLVNTPGDNIFTPTHVFASMSEGKLKCSSGKIPPYTGGRPLSASAS
jgi:hypothetical protein